ncbi:TolC family protein [Vibrio genomosp. F10]|uniref:TolC family protein n=1 Tax=Vibrio genomosp. F10 TaxID=723171 RepID=UPI000308E63D|nr:TolC family protein [Vibrio genomosp. F10]OEE88862.1 hypothetical protein A1QK_03350 [Vibrio genomosp. F10 str. 9ZD137]
MVNQYLVSMSGLLLSVALSPPSQAISIEEAWQQAKQIDPDYEKAQISVQLGESSVDLSRSSLLPALSANASANWREKRGNSSRYGAELSQVIWDSRLWSELDKAQSNFLKSQLELIKVHNNLAAKLLFIYLDMAAAQGNLQLATSKLEEGSKLLEIAEKRYAAGKVKSIDVQDIRANQLSEKSGILRAQAELRSKKYELEALINQLPDAVDQIRTDNLIKPTMLVSSQQQWLKIARNNSPELLVAIEEVKARELEKKSAQGGYYPTVQGHVGYGGDDNLSDGEFDAGLTIRVPIDLNGSTRSKIEQSSLNVLIAKQDLRKVEIDIKKRIEQSFTQVEFNWEQVLIAHHLVESRSAVLYSKEKLYDAGFLEASDVISAHNNLFSSRYLLQTNLYDYWRQRIELLKATGKLDDDIMALISQALHHG